MLGGFSGGCRRRRVHGERSYMKDKTVIADADRFVVTNVW